METEFKDKIVFVSGPYSSPDEEIKTKRFKTSAIACGAIMELGGFPLSPVVHGVPIAWEMSLPDDWTYWKKYCMALVSKSDMVVVLMVDGWDKSSGVKGEIEAAHELGKPVFFYQLVTTNVNGHFMSSLLFIREIKK